MIELEAIERIDIQAIEAWDTRILMSDSPDITININESEEEASAENVDVVETIGVLELLTLRAEGVEIIQIVGMGLGLPGPGVPSGGTTGQFYRKKSNIDYDGEWHTLTKSDVGLGNVDNTSDADKPVSDATALAIEAVADDLSDHIGDTSNPHSVTKTQVGLGNADNTSDVNKPISSATQTALDAKINTSARGVANGVASLGSDGKVPNAQMPAIAITHYLGTFATTAAALADAGVYASEEGDWFMVNANGGENWIVTTNNPTTLSHITKMVGSPAYTDEMAQDAIGAMVNSTLTYVDSTPLLGINLANANTWTNYIASRRDSLGLTSVDAFVADNQTAGTTSLNQVSPRFRRRGRGFYTNSSTSYAVDVIDHVIGSKNITGGGRWRMQWGINDANYQDAFELDFTVGGRGAVFTAPAALSNGSPGTTRNATWENTGTTSYFDFTFNTVRKVSLGFTSSGEFQVWSKGGNHNGYYDDSGLYAYLYRTAFVHSSGHGSFSGGVNAGNSSNSLPPSTLTSHGGVGSTAVYLTQNTTLTNEYHLVIVNGDNTFACTGSPTNPCGTYTNEGDCNARDHHGNCSWSSQDCSAWNGQGQGSCEAHSGCTYVTQSCSGPGDSMTCTDQNNAYGGDCAWVDANPSCSGFDESTCYSMSGSGCSQSFGSCTANYTYPCSWDSGMGVCGGADPCSTFGDESTCNNYNYFSSCTGDTGCDAQGSPEACTSYFPFLGCNGNYSSYSCTGNFFTGTCSGSSGACSGTSSCYSISEAYCSSEPGCSAGFGVALTFPSDSTYSTGFKRGYKIVNKGATRAVTVIPYPGSTQTVNDTTSFSIPAQNTYEFDFVWFQRSCSEFSTSGTCASPCTWVDCSSYGDESSCNSAGCSWDSMESICNGGTFCYGTYTPYHDWTITGHATF